MTPATQPALCQRGATPLVLGSSMHAISKISPEKGNMAKGKAVFFANL
jgi:hypothetical protein